MKQVLVAALMILTLSAGAYSQSGGTVWFYRTTEGASSVPQRKIYETTFPTRHLATLAAGEYFGFAAQPGTHAFSFTSAPARGQSVAVSIDAGQHVYVEVGANSIGIVSQAVGVRAIQESRSIGTMAAVDDAVILGMALPPLPNSARLINAAFARPAQALPQVAQGIGGGDELHRFELAFNPYSWVQILGVDYHGIGASLGIHIADNFAIVADFGINRSSRVLGIEGIEDFDIDPKLELFAFRFGPRFTARSGRTSIFGQILVGGAHQRLITGFDIVGVAGELNETSHGWSGLAGGGIDIGVSDWFSIRAIQAEYSPFYIDGEVAHGPRITAGFVFHLH